MNLIYNIIANVNVNRWTSYLNLYAKEVNVWFKIFLGWKITDSQNRSSNSSAVEKQKEIGLRMLDKTKNS